MSNFAMISQKAYASFGHHESEVAISSKSKYSYYSRCTAFGIKWINLL